mgnify:FL=1
MQRYRTDLARESRELAGNDLQGVTQSKEQHGPLLVERIVIETPEAADRLDKPQGRYITIDADNLSDREPEVFTALSERIAEELSNLLDGIPEQADMMVIGLGNRFVTPDALGPETADRIYVTRHIRTNAPELAPQGMRAVSAMAPGVLGTTGMETVEVVKGLVEHAKPAAVICVDALAARSTDRIHRTVQLSDTGISPGSGIGNMRDTLNRETLGVPVIAIGIPMVVYAATIAADTIGMVAQRTGLPDNEALRALVDEVVREHFGPMIVTPKDIDLLTEDAAEILSNGINRMLHRAYYAEIEALLE